MQHLPRSTWLHLLQGTDPRLTVLNSFFYCDEPNPLQHGLAAARARVAAGVG